MAETCCNESQSEELEVLNSIYLGDPGFKENGPGWLQYKCGDLSNHTRSFVVDVRWPADYPDQMPVISMDSFYNKYIPEESRKQFVENLYEGCAPYIGCAMTFNIFELAKEKADCFIESFCTKLNEASSHSPNQSAGSTSVTLPAKPKKEQLSKAQKRRMADQLNAQGERERGWDWVDVVKHLSQVGAQKQLAPNAV